MKIEIRRFKVTVHGLQDYRTIVEQPTESEAFAYVRYEHKLPIGIKMTAKEMRPRVIETEEA